MIFTQVFQKSPHSFVVGEVGQLPLKHNRVPFDIFFQFGLVNGEDNLLRDAVDALESPLVRRATKAKEQGSNQSSPAYHNAEGEHVRRLLDWASRVRFRTSPHPITKLHRRERLIRRKVLGLLEIGELHILDDRARAVFLGVKEDVVRLDI